MSKDLLTFLFDLVGRQQFVSSHRCGANSALCILNPLFRSWKSSSYAWNILLRLSASPLFSSLSGCPQCVRLSVGPAGRSNRRGSLRSALSSSSSSPLTSCPSFRVPRFVSLFMFFSTLKASDLVLVLVWYMAQDQCLCSFDHMESN